MWEHAHGIEIATLDNPGWKVTLTGASSGKAVDLAIERDE
ncbi:Imm53 family immunity protein [Burkholderia lata]